MPLTITIPAGRGWNAVKEEFEYNKTPVTIVLEHSLVSVSKWESKYHKPFISKDKKTKEELIDYIRFMTITQNVNPSAYYFLSDDNLRTINNYIDDSHTATTFHVDPRGAYNPPTKREVITSEIIYFWMITYQIPFECQKWHLNHLMTLIRVCNAKQDGGKKMSKKETAASNRALNNARRKRMHSKG